MSVQPQQSAIAVVVVVVVRDDSSVSGGVSGGLKLKLSLSLASTVFLLLHILSVFVLWLNIFLSFLVRRSSVDPTARLSV